MYFDYDHIRRQDETLYNAIVGEEQRQAAGLELIPSENYASAAVREALASPLTNKYAEGYPGKRYYGGQTYTDAVESAAIERARELFGASYANVQPLSGAAANLAVYSALLEPGATVLGMDLSHGGHLTHGHPVTLPAQFYTFQRYQMKDIETGEIDYEALRESARQHQPTILLAGFSAYPRELDYAQFVSIAREVGAYAMADVAHIAGLIAGGALANPLEAGFDVMTTTTHKSLRGPRGGLILVREDSELAKRINKAVFPGLQGGPHMHNIAAKAVAFDEARQSSFGDYARQVIANARAMADVFAERNVRMITGGTDSHLLLLDVMSSFSITGAEAQDALDAVGLTANKNALPDDDRSPMDPSGLRLGTPALTSRGMREAESRQIAEGICEVLEQLDDAAVQERVREAVRSLCEQYPVPNQYI